MRKPVKKYALLRPDGSIVDIQTQASGRDAFWHGSFVEITEGTGEELKVQDSFGARCWRANSNSFSWTHELAVEIGSAIGYRAVTATILVHDED